MNKDNGIAAPGFFDVQSHALRIHKAHVLTLDKSLSGSSRREKVTTPRTRDW